MSDDKNQVPDAKAAISPPLVDDDSTILVSSAHKDWKAKPVSMSGSELPNRGELKADRALAPASNPSTVPDQSIIEPAAPSMPLGLNMPLSSLEVGTVINNMYRVVEQLNQGGMGRVYRGEEIGTGEPVAIKVILPEMAEDKKVAAMFKREARTLRQLHHDAIVRYFAYVPPDQNLNLHALVMGFIQGTTLSDALKNNGPLARDQVIALTMRLADGLEGAHKAGVIHRDLSPDNVMLESGEIDKAVLIDFGISRSSTVKDVTIGNDFAGKLRYVSPEQLGAFGGEAAGPSDVYSLGLLMIAMLAGKSLDMGASIVGAVQMRQSVPDLSNINPEFQSLLNKMLQPDPAQRLSSMRGVIEELCLLGGVSRLGGSLMRGTLPPVKAADRAVPGLQAVPFSAKTRDTKAKPKMENDTKPPEVKKSGQKIAQIVGLLTLVFALVTLGSVIYLLEDDWTSLKMPADWSFPNATATTERTSDPVTDGLERMEGSRATFLAKAVPDSCAYATLRMYGKNSGVIEVFSENLSLLRNIGDDFRTQFNTSPDIIPRSTPSVHCDVLNFANAFQGTRGDDIELSLEKNTLSGLNEIKGTLNGSSGRKNWLALVDPDGRIYSLMEQFDEPIGDQRYFEFRLSNNAQAGIYMLISTASEKTLVRSGALKDGTATEKFLPLLSRELAQDGIGAVDISYIELMP
tara:strand:+ start:7044 stop:9107 length:2064 start_codon:yes stop_codon:yes gene_type:complete